MDTECSMCKNTPHRRCTSNFAQKYLSGDAIKSKCGANILVEVIDRSTGETAPAEAVRGLHLEVRQYLLVPDINSSYVSYTCKTDNGRQVKNSWAEALAVKAWQSKELYQGQTLPQRTLFAVQP